MLNMESGEVKILSAKSNFLNRKKNNCWNKSVNSEIKYKEYEIKALQMPKKWNRKKRSKEKKIWQYWMINSIETSIIIKAFWTSSRLLLAAALMQDSYYSNNCVSLIRLRAFLETASLIVLPCRKVMLAWQLEKVELMSIGKSATWLSRMTFNWFWKLSSLEEICMRISESSCSINSAFPLILLSMLASEQFYSRIGQFNLQLFYGLISSWTHLLH